MEDNAGNEDPNINKYSDRYEKGVNELAQEKELKTKWHREILENKAMQEHFKGFHPTSVATFITFYLAEKYIAYKYADSYQKRLEKKRSKWIDQAHDHLKVIQNKKLFDLQCLWRAEQVTQEGVQLCYDFKAWSEDILNCPFLEPVTRDEIVMYQAFLHKDGLDFDTLSDLHDLQDYEGFKANYTSKDDDASILPDWYEFHNIRTGNAALLLLPDLRGGKEEFYAHLFRKERDKDLPPRSLSFLEDRPFLLTSDKEEVLHFVTTFEDEETRRNYTNYKEVSKRDFDDNEYDISELLMYMEEEEEHIPIKASYDYREALYQAYNSFKLKKLAEHMPMAREQYLFTRTMGLTTEPKNNFFSTLKDSYLQMILKGRELNGEERNLEF